MWLSIVVLVCSLALPGEVRAQARDRGADPLQAVGLDQRLGEQVPLDLAFRDETGRSVTLSDYFGGTPVILVPAYHTCRNLCPLVLDGLVKSLRALSFRIGEHFAVITVSIDPRDTPASAASKKAMVVQRLARPGVADGWHFLTGEEPSIQRLARSIGLRYGIDAKSDEYLHASGILVLTPRGGISRYFYGIEYSPRDLRLALVEASDNRIGSLVDQVLLRCYRYDSATGTYGLVIMNVVRLAGLATILALGAFVAVMVRRERRGQLTA
jgi:protein SCO1/2